MNDFLSWLASSPFGSWLKAFIAFVLGAAVVDWSSSGSISLDTWQAWIIGGLAATIAPLINWLNSADPRYGRGAGNE